MLGVGRCLLKRRRGRGLLLLFFNPQSEIRIPQPLHGQADGEAAAAPRARARGRDRAAVRLDEAAHEREADP
jgi:hypothetical protein